MSQSDVVTDVVELCALLQCLGFSVKSLVTNDENISQDGGTRTVIINCQSSGLQVVLESATLSCSCPAATSAQNSGIWQVDGVAGGEQFDKEFGCSLLGSLPKTHRDRLTKELRDMIRCIKEHNDSDVEKMKEKEVIANESASMTDSKTSEEILFQLKSDTPTRYRSLDTLTARKEGTEELPAPASLLKFHPVTEPSTEDASSDKKQRKCRQQSTYTLSSAPGSVKLRNKTLSPIHGHQTNPLECLLEAEKAADNLRDELAYAIKAFIEDGKHDSSMSSLTLDVSKISVLKGTEFSKQFASSPNLSGLSGVQEDFTKSKLKRLESASTSNLAPNISAPGKKKPSRLPHIVKLRKEIPEVKVDKIKTQGVFGTKGIAPVRTPKANPEPSPNLSASERRRQYRLKRRL